MTSRYATATALAGLLTLCACKSTRTTTPTQTLVIVDAEENVRDRTGELHIEVIPQQADGEPRDQRFEGDALIWPRVLSLAPKDRDASRTYEVVATALDEDGEFLARVRAISGYAKGRRVVLVLVFDDACIDVTCSDEETCAGGSCGGAEIDPAELAPFEGEDLDDLDLAGFRNPPGDAGLDSGADTSTPPEVPADAGPDTGDARFDAAPDGCVAEDETCNTKDDDCDGEIDEMLMRPCGTSVGECMDGVQECMDGRWTACVGQITGNAEICDGLDNDCDGKKDNGAICNPLLYPFIDTAACMGGKCVVTACEGTRRDCDDDYETGCEVDTQSNALHCGACGDPCVTRTKVTAVSCIGGGCIATGCSAGFANCDGNDTCETNGSCPMPDAGVDAAF